MTAAFERNIWKINVLILSYLCSHAYNKILGFPHNLLRYLVGCRNNSSFLPSFVTTCPLTKLLGATNKLKSRERFHPSLKTIKNKHSTILICSQEKERPRYSRIPPWKPRPFLFLLSFLLSLPWAAFFISFLETRRTTILF